MPEPNRGRRRLVIYAAALLLLLAGAALAAYLAEFGPFEDDASSAVSERDFLERGDEICLEGRRRFAELQEDPPRTATESAELTRELISIAEGEVASLRALDAPEDLGAPLATYLDAREEGIDVLRDGLEAAEAEDAAAYLAAQGRIAEDQQERLTLAREVGFSECSRPLSAALPED